jgi:hypothetical protein
LAHTAKQHRKPDGGKDEDCGDVTPLAALRGLPFVHAPINGEAGGAFPPALAS